MPGLNPRPSPDTRLQPRGSRHGGQRQYNERVVLQAVRLHGALASAEIARLTRLTPQTVSLIGKQLLDEGLLLRGEPQRGKVGQPSVPLSLNPDGAYAVGIKVGRRSLDTLLIDFTGRPCDRWSLDYPHADPQAVVTEIGARLDEIRQQLGPTRSARVQGVGIAAPLAMGGWQQLLGLPAEVADQWQHFDLRAAVAARSDWPVSLTKDTAAACVAELVAGRGRAVSSFLYVFVDTFIGGGLVIDGRWRPGITGNAGAVGSMPLGPGTQLLGVASLLTLERRFAAVGLDTAAAHDARCLQPPWQAQTEAWLGEAGAALAHAIAGAACLIDLEGVVVDGSFDRSLLQALMAAVHTAGDAHSWEGVARPPLLAGSIGSDARALGGALLPLYANFAPDRELFLKDAVEPVEPA